jgi:hypothetical protein
MAITAQQMVDRALRLLGAVDPEEAPSAQERTDALYALNSMLDAWQLEELMVFENVDVSKTLVPGTASYTIGVGGAINVARPNRISYAFLVDAGIRYDLGRPIAEQQFKSIITTEVQSAIPTVIWYDESYPLASVNLYPIPSKALTLHLIVWQALQSFASLSAELALPPGYQLAIEMNLAVHMAPEFEKEAPAFVRDEAKRAKSKIKTLNSAQFIPAVCELAIARAGGRWDFNTGEYR